ncbi:hypothetical protein D3C86_1698510 [compost metagenome]
MDIERNHNDKFDNRLNQPVAKTVGRRLPISESLEEQIIEYLTNWRAEVIGVEFTDEAFIFVVHRGGRSQGKALPKTSFNTGLTHLKKYFHSINPVHPHLLRHDWNYRFSKEADSQSLPLEEERTLREQLMGWMPDSPMSRIYNLRHIEEKSFEIGRRIASDTTRATA